MKEVRNLKNTLKKRVRPALLAVILLFTMGFSGYSSKANAATSTSVKINTPSNQTITIDKTAEHYKDDLYKIKFDINGTVPQKEAIKADIIMVMDVSGSMGYNAGNSGKTRLQIAKEAAKDFVNTIFNDGMNADVRIAMSTFSQGATNISDFVGKDQKTILTNKISEIQANGETNTESGIREILRLLKKSKEANSNVKQYVLFFTDGLPTADNDHWTLLQGYSPKDIYFKSAQLAYNEIKKTINPVGGIGEKSIIPYYDNSPREDKRTSGVNLYPNTKFYSVGLITGDNEEKNMAKKLLSSMQSISSTQEDWVKDYYIDDATLIKSKFDAIANEMRTDINTTFIKDGKITDILPSTFTLPQDAADKDIAVKVNGASVNPSEGFFKVVSSNPETIELDLSKITQTPQNNRVHIEISYNVTLADPYFSGKDVPTNVSATLTGKDPLKPTESIEGIFPVPHVTIEPKVGSITVDKVVKGSNTFDTTFPISIQKVGSTAKYNIDLSAGDMKTMNAYLRGNDSTVYDTAWYETGDKVALSKYGYLTAGTYKVSEIVPMDYSGKPIIKVSYNENPDWSKIDPSDTFTIDKKHSNVYIHVENTVNNNSYWRDRSDVSNTFNYTGK